MPDSRSRARVLCVDDDEMLLVIFERFLSREFEVVTASNGPDGLERLDDSGPFAVVIADLTMPGMSGSVFLSEVRRRAPETARIMLTGCAQVVGADEAVRAGHVLRFVSKPCTPQALIEVVRLGVEHHESRRAA